MQEIVGGEAVGARLEVVSIPRRGRVNHGTKRATR